MKKRVSFFLILITLLLMTTPVFAAKNKSGCFSMSFYKQLYSDEEGWTQTEWDNNAYDFDVILKEKMKLKKTMYMSAKIYVPQSYFKKNLDEIGFHLDGFAFSRNGDNPKGEYAFSSKYWIFIRLTNGKVTIRRYNELTDKEEKIGSMGTLKKSGKYYVVTMKNVPYKPTAYSIPKSRDNVKYNTSKKYYLIPQIMIWNNVARKGTTDIYIDEVFVTGSKKLGTTFDKKNYEDVMASRRSDREQLKVDIVNTP